MGATVVWIHVLLSCVSKWFRMALKHVLELIYTDHKSAPCLEVVSIVYMEPACKNDQLMFVHICMTDCFRI